MHNQRPLRSRPTGPRAPATTLTLANIWPYRVQRSQHGGCTTVGQQKTAALRGASNTTVRIKLDVLLNAVKSLEQGVAHDPTTADAAAIAEQKERVDNAANALARELAALEHRNKVRLAVISAVTSIVVAGLTAGLTFVTSQRKAEPGSKTVREPGPAHATTAPAGADCRRAAISTVADLATVSESTACMSAADCQRLVDSYKTTACSSNCESIRDRKDLRSRSAQNSCIAASSCEDLITSSTVIVYEAAKLSPQVDQLMSTENCYSLLATASPKQDPRDASRCKKQLEEGGWIVKQPRESQSLADMVAILEQNGRAVFDQDKLKDLKTRERADATESLSRVLAEKTKSLEHCERRWTNHQYECKCLK
jgi:hypothetical protein